MFQNFHSVSRRSGRTFGASVVLHVLAVFALALLGTASQSPLNVTERYRSVTIFAPTGPLVNEVKTPPRQRRRRAAPPKRARVAPPRGNRAPVHKALAADPPKVRMEPAAPQAPEIAVQTPPPPLAEPEWKTGLLALATASYTPMAPRESVQAAGFGKATTSKEAVPSLSVPGVPSAFGRVGPATSVGARWRNARYERPTEGAAAFGQARAGTRWAPAGQERSTGAGGAGFGEVKAGGGQALHSRPAKQAGFTEMVYSNDVKTTAVPDSHARPSTGVKILAKPQPKYTPEARKLHIEGEVRLEVLFAASGDIEVLKVAQGLGHGLDENAIEAAKRIRFEPALRNGEPVDLAATVRIRFQLAY